MSWFNGVIGQGIATNLGGAGQMAQQNAAQASQYSSLAQNQQAYAQQQAMAAQQACGGQMSAGAYQGISQPMRWMFDGALMSIMDFANKIWPEDCADKTHFILKYSKGE